MNTRVIRFNLRIAIQADKRQLKTSLLHRLVPRRPTKGTRNKASRSIQLRGDQR
jgi:hypothetical protein